MFHGFGFSLKAVNMNNISLTLNKSQVGCSELNDKCCRSEFVTFRD